MMALTLVWFLHIFDNERFIWNIQYGEWLHCERNECDTHRQDSWH